METTTNPVLEHALKYAQAGIAVLPVYGSDGKGNCACGNKCPEKNRGKHPALQNGAHGATTDLNQIRRWFTEHPDYNVGVAGGNGFIFVDIDDAVIASELLDNDDLNLAASTPVDLAEQGAHIWLKTTGDDEVKQNINVGGRHVGEIRGSGYYIIAPPSQHRLGKKYHFAGGFNEFMSVDDVHKFVEEMFAWIGITVDPWRDKTIVEGPESIDAIPFPYDIPNDPEWTYLRQCLSGTYPTKDRSQELLRLTRTIVDFCIRTGNHLNKSQVAGIVKYTDALGWKKYSGRADGQQYYWEKVCKAFAEHGDINAPTSEQLPLTKDTTPFMFLPGSGGLLYSRPRSDTLICNFKPILEEEVTVVLPNGTTEHNYTMRLELEPGNDCEIRIGAEERSQPAKMMASISNQAPYTYIVEPGQAGHVYNAAMKFSNSVDEYVEYAQTGWHNGIFLLPGSEGAIAAGGHADDIRFSPTAPLSNANIKRYGMGVRPVTSQHEQQLAASAFSRLLQTAPPGIVVPLVAQIMAGPLMPFGASKNPPLLHLQGRTQSFKTSLSTCALSLFGNFDYDCAPESWRSTGNSLLDTLSTLKDLTLLVDNYKVTMRAASETVVQTYADHQVRGRLSSDAKQRHTTLPKALLLSTGEDMWDESESTRARSLVIPVGRGDVDMAALSVSQKDAEAGYLALVGGTYLQWLAKQDHDELSRKYEEWREAFRILLAERKIVQRRMINTLANLMTAERVVEEFLMYELPDALDVLQRAALTAWKVSLDHVEEEANDAARQSSFNKFAEYIEAAITTEKARILPFRGADGILGGWMADIIGYHDGDYLYLSNKVTYTWANQYCKQRGLELGFSWRNFSQEAEAEHSAVKNKTYYIPKVGETGGWLRLPLTEIFQTPVDELMRTTPEEGLFDYEP